LVWGVWVWWGLWVVGGWGVFLVVVGGFVLLFVFVGFLVGVFFCSLGQVTNALFEVGGQYRRNM
jgi:hypothetical protein